MRADSHGYTIRKATLAGRDRLRAFHRRGIARALLERLEAEARAAKLSELSTDASLIAHPVFLDAGFEVVAWEVHGSRGRSFRRARMRKALR